MYIYTVHRPKPIGHISLLPLLALNSLCNMKDHFSASRRKKPKIKLVCCFNGTFQPHPPSGNLRYAGGDFRILSLDRNTGFSRLKSKILKLFSCPNGTRSFSLLYNLSDAISDTQLALITCDDDVFRMIDDYDKLDSYGTHPRLWVFVCHGNVIGNVVEKPCVDFTRKLKACLSGVDDDDKYKLIDARVTDNSLGKLALRQQLLAKHPAKIGNSPIPPDSRFEFEETWVQCDHGKEFSNNCFETEAPLSHERRNPNNVVDSYNVNNQNGGTASSLDHSLLHNPSLPSFKEMLSLTTVSDATEALLKPQSKLFDVMDEEHFTSGPQVDKSTEATSNPSSHKTERVDDEMAETKQELLSNFSFGKNGRSKCLKIEGGIPADLATFFTHLPTREIQTINNSDLEYLKEIGSGTYGTVFYGKWKGSDVAIKKIKPCCFNEGPLEENRIVSNFWKEAHTLGQLHHPNIVALYGAVTDGPVSNLAAVTEYMVNGSLKQVLRRKDRTIDRRKRLIIAMDAAFGMEYLHGKNLVHFDLKSHNFLVNMRDPQRPVCKISDLGLSKIKQKTLVSGGVRGTIPWMAPELLKNESMVTEKVDVYSFGIVMWELLTGEDPYANMRSQEIIGDIIRGTLRPEIPSWCDPAWKSLMERCWSSDSEARPSFSEIAKELRAMAAAMNIK